MIFDNPDGMNGFNSYIKSVAKEPFTSGLQQETSSKELESWREELFSISSGMLDSAVNSCTCIKRHMNVSYNHLLMMFYTHGNTVRFYRPEV